MTLRCKELWFYDIVKGGGYLQLRDVMSFKNQEDGKIWNYWVKIKRDTARNFFLGIRNLNT